MLALLWNAPKHRSVRCWPLQRESGEKFLVTFYGRVVVSSAHNLERSPPLACSWVRRFLSTVLLVREFSRWFQTLSTVNATPCGCDPSIYLCLPLLLHFSYRLSHWHPPFAIHGPYFYHIIPYIFAKQANGSSSRFWFDHHGKDEWTWLTRPRPTSSHAERQHEND